MLFSLLQAMKLKRFSSVLKTCAKEWKSSFSNIQPQHQCLQKLFHLKIISWQLSVLIKDLKLKNWWRINYSKIHGMEKPFTLRMRITSTMMLWLHLILVSFTMDKWLVPQMPFICLWIVLSICACTNNFGKISTIDGGMIWILLQIIHSTLNLWAAKLGTASSANNLHKIISTLISDMMLSPNVTALFKMLCHLNLWIEQRLEVEISCLKMDNHTTNTMIHSFWQRRIWWNILTNMKLT